MLVLAHRGASVAAPENTPAAFRIARAMGADGVELDVRAAPDGRLVVRHDPLPPELVGGALDRLPDLGVALDACGPETLVNVEVKIDRPAAGPPTVAEVADVVERLVDVLDRRGPADAHRWLVSSFSWDVLARLRAVAPGLATAWLVHEVGDGAIGDVAEAGHVAIHPWVGALTAATVSRCHDAGLAVHAWTCNDAQRLVELEADGVDGVCTDVPDVALAALGRSPGRTGGALSRRWGRPA